MSILWYEEGKGDGSGQKRGRFYLFFLKINRTVPFSVFLLFFLSACGYHIAGKGSHIQYGIKSIAIPVFENKTMEPIIEEEFTPAVIREFLKDGRLNVVGRPQAGLLLEGSINSYREIPLSFDQNQNVLDYRITVIMHLKLLQQPTSNILWERDIIKSAEYMVSSDVMSTRFSKLLTIREIAQNVAEEVTERVLWGW